MHICLLGGIGPSATDFYYRHLIQRASELGRELELTIAHADAKTLLGNLNSDNASAQTEIFLRLTKRLERAGADCVVITSIAGHFCIDSFAAASPLPVIDITQAVAIWLERERLNRVGILGTEAVMASAMFGKLGAVDVLQPRAAVRSDVHHAYTTLAQSTSPRPDMHPVFLEAGADMIARGAEAVLLGGTDLNVVFLDRPAPFPIVDCALIHVDQVAQFI